MEDMAIMVNMDVIVIIQKKLKMILKDKIDSSSISDKMVKVVI